MIRCVFSISTSGIFNKSLLKEVCDWLNNSGIQTKQVDTVAGWWNLDQDWYEFEDEAETDFRWVRPKSLREEDWEQLWRHLNYGNLIMQVHYIRFIDGKKVLDPHR